jgi:hypothetical protein
MTAQQVGAASLMLAAEASMISAEVLAARGNWYAPGILLLQIVAAVLLLVAYNVGFKAWNDIWVVSITSVVTVVLSEPIIVWLIAGALPTRYTLAAFALAISALGVLTLEP